MNGNPKGKITAIGVSIFFVFLGIAAWIENADLQDYDASYLGQRILTECQKEIVYEAFPIFGYAGKEMWKEEMPPEARWLVSHIPIYEYSMEAVSLEPMEGDAETYQDLENMAETNLGMHVQEQEGVIETPDFYDEMMNENKHAVLFAKDTDFFFAGSGFVSEVSSFWITEFVKATSKSTEYEYEQLTDYEFVMEHFYTVDACTSAGPDLMRPQMFLEYDCTIDKSAPGPHILIYHTHSQEAFADSVAGDKSTTIVGAGAKLSEILREEYGYEVYHHTGEYDINTRDDAYAKSAPALEEILEQYPQIQVIIDLHRDGVADSRHLVTDWNGKTVAQFMFFNGLSYVNTKGPIDYLPNPNLSGNLALSYQATVIANEYYPGMTRRTYLNGYRYNMHYRDKTMLIELGAQTNTVDEIMSACEPLAHVLDMVFSGEEKR